MRWRIAGSVLVAAVVVLTGCTRAEAPPPAPRQPQPGFSMHQLPPSPSPLQIGVQAGAVEGLIPADWQAEPLSGTRYPQQGFVASPELADWEGGAGLVRGMEAFWVDVGSLHISSDLYYLVARGPAMAALTANKDCHPTHQEVLADHPPALDGGLSPGDYIATATGTCRTDGQLTHWAYIVAAPGFGPEREMGLTTSGLYVVLAVVSGRQSAALLQAMLDGARFDHVPITQIVAAARTAA